MIRFAEEVGAQWANEQLLVRFKLALSTEERIRVSYRFVRVKPIGAVPIQLPNNRTSVETLPYVFVVSNTGSVDITNVQLYSAVTFNGNTTRDRIPIVPITLRAGQSTEVAPAAAFDPRGLLGTIDISVTGIGVSTQPRVVGAAANASVSVTAAPA